MQDAIVVTLGILAVVVFAAAPRYAKAYRATGNAFGLVATVLCLALGIWLVYAAYWLSAKS